MTWTAHTSLASRRLRASEAGSAGHRSRGGGGASSRPWKGEEAQDCFRSRAAGVQLKLKHSCCL